MCAYCERDHAYERAKKASAAARAEKAKELEEKVKKSSQEKTEAKVALDKIMAKFVRHSCGGAQFINGKVSL